MSGICALLGSVAPEREAVPLDDPRKLGAVVGRGRRRAGRLAAAREALAPAPAAADGATRPSAPLRDGRPASRGGLRGHALPRHGAGRGRHRPRRDRPDPRVRRRARGAETSEERARLAVDELERLGAFERARILVCSRDAARLREPDPGRGRGAPRGRRRRLRRRSSTSTGARCFMPLEGAGSPRARTARCSRSCGGGCRRGVEVCVYGESLGAWASQNVFRARRRACARRGARGAGAVDRDAVLLAASPRLLASGAIPSDARVATVPVARPGRRARRRRRRPRFVFVARRTDPVVLFRGLDLIWRRPDWLPPGSWTPGITFLQLAFDLVAATNWPVDACPQALAHDYRLEGPLGRRPRVRPPRGPRAARRARRPARRRGGRARGADPCAEARRRLYSEPLNTRSRLCGAPLDGPPHPHQPSAGPA